MARLPHYFTHFQTFVVSRAEEDRSRFDQKTALDVLQHEARYRSGTPTPAGLFAYQFESISRNKLGYDRGMEAMAQDPQYDEMWREWIRRTRLQLGAVDFADLMYVYSDEWLNERRRTSGLARPSVAAPDSVRRQGRADRQGQSREGPALHVRRAAAAPGLS